MISVFHIKFFGFSSFLGVCRGVDVDMIVVVVVGFVDIDLLCKVDGVICGQHLLYVLGWLKVVVT